MMDNGIFLIFISFFTRQSIRVRIKLQGSTPLYDRFILSSSLPHLIIYYSYLIILLTINTVTKDMLIYENRKLTLYLLKILPLQRKSSTIHYHNAL